MLTFSKINKSVYFFNWVNLRNNNKVQMNQKLVEEEKKDEEKAREQDKQAEFYMHRGLIRTIERYLFRIGLGLLVIAKAFAILFSDVFREQFLDYLKEHKNQISIYFTVILAIIIFAMDELQTINTNLTPLTKKWMNFVEDILRGAVYGFVINLLTNFIKDHLNQVVLVASYIIIILCAIVFLIFRLLKWIYFICGKGKGNLKPWEKKQESLSQAQKRCIEQYIDQYLQFKNQKAKYK